MCMQESYDLSFHHYINSTTFTKHGNYDSHHPALMVRRSSKLEITEQALSRTIHRGGITRCPAATGFGAGRHRLPSVPPQLRQSCPSTASNAETSLQGARAGLFAWCPYAPCKQSLQQQQLRGCATITGHTSPNYQATVCHFLSSKREKTVKPY